MSLIRRWCVLVGTALADAWVLVRLAPDWIGLSRGLQAPHAWVSRAGADQAALALVTAALWLTAAWLALGLAATLAGRCPGRFGRGSHILASRVAPRTLRRIVIGAAGASILLGSSSALAAPGPTPPTSTVVATTSERTPPIPPVPWPTSTGSGSIAPLPVAVVPLPPPDAKPGRRAAQPAQESRVTVAAGQSLWLIAAHRLGPTASDQQVATEWPRWYRANRGVIGADPGLIRPGQRLTVPTAKT
ncbi:MAG: LysM peptidoglycan-binding protein [Frankiales bacterium]|nr:LysM peptidoglycan-binding protein [Frankiales bacterium]